MSGKSGKIYLNPNKIINGVNTVSSIYVNPNFKKVNLDHNIFPTLSSQDVSGGNRKLNNSDSECTVQKNVHINPAKLKETKIHINPKFVRQCENEQVPAVQEMKKPSLNINVKNVQNDFSQLNQFKYHQNRFKYESSPYKKSINTVSKVFLPPKNVCDENSFNKFPPFNKLKLLNGTKPVIKKLRTKYKLINQGKMKGHNKFSRVGVSSKYKFVREGGNVSLSNALKYDKLMTPTSGKANLRNRRLPHNSFSFVNNKYCKTFRTKPDKISQNLANISNPSKLISVRGVKYCLDSKNRVMKRISNDQSQLPTLSTLYVGKYKYIRRPSGIYVKQAPSKAFSIANNVKLKSINILANKYKKNNQDCAFFRKFGHCPRKKRNLCHYRHDPNRITLCKNFIRGKCYNHSCKLSHKIAPEKMPTCSFFLQGTCVRDICPYLHVKVNPNAKVCQEFLKGFCHLADKCKLRHSNICPEFEAKGKCTQSYCCLEHKVEKKKTAKRSGLSRSFKHKTSRLSATSKAAHQKTNHTTEATLVDRYFVPNHNATGDSNIGGPSDTATEKKIVEFLPSFISLKEYDSE